MHSELTAIRKLQVQVLEIQGTRPCVMASCCASQAAVHTHQVAVQVLPLAVPAQSSGKAPFSGSAGILLQPAVQQRAMGQYRLVAHECCTLAHGAIPSDPQKANQLQKTVFAAMCQSTKVPTMQSWAEPLKKTASPYTNRMVAWLSVLHGYLWLQLYAELSGSHLRSPEAA